MWSPLAEQVVSRLIADRSENLDSETRSHAERLKALPILWDLWGSYFLRANGELVVVGEDLYLPDVDTIYTEGSKYLRTLVLGSKRYPDLKQLLPVRGPGSVDCRHGDFQLFVEGRFPCPFCHGLGWLPNDGV